MQGTTKITFADEHEVEMVIDTRADPHVELAHETRDVWKPTFTRYRIALAWTPCRFGGGRWWFICPVRGRYVAKLYLPCGGGRFLSGRAYGLGYACQREEPRDRATRRLRRIDRALGGGSDAQPDEPPEKPKWMRWRTYERKVAEWWAASDRVEDAWALTIARFMQQYS
jgi:hypothetical protein